MALAERHPAAGCIHHSDQGVQYASTEYIKELKDHGFLISMSRKGNPYDNAQAESFFKTLKYEEVNLWNYRTLDDVIARVPYFIQEVYNTKRLHSSIGYVPPEEYEAQLRHVKEPDSKSKILSTITNWVSSFRGSLHNMITISILFHKLLKITGNSVSYVCESSLFRIFIKFRNSL